jgi:Fic family protein
LKKAGFFEKYKDQFNESILKGNRRILKERAVGNDLEMNVRKYVFTSKASNATATWDLQNSLENKIVERKGRGRSMVYIIKLE